MAVTMAAMNAWAQSPVPPTSATQEEWHVAAIFTSGDQSEDVNETMAVVFDGNDIYFNFPNPITGNTWMKGTRNGETVTFAKGQKVGTYGGQNIYYMGLDENGLCDIVFNYDEGNGLFTMTDMWLTLNGSLTKNSALGYFSPVVVTRNDSESEAQSYVMTGKNVNPNNQEQYENINETVLVRIDGSNIAIQGLSAYDPAVWLKGTISEGIATFAKRQPAGSYNNTALYFIGYDGSETDIIFSYDAETGVLIAGQYILCIAADGDTYELLQDIVLAPKDGSGDTPMPEVVTPPAGLKASPYIFTGNKMLTDEEGGYLGTEEVKYNVKLGFYNNNTEVFIQGLCNYLPEAWVKGTVGEEFLGAQPVTFAKGQFYGQYGLYPLYLAARQGNYLTNMVLNYDSQKREFTNESGVYLVTNLMPDQPAVVDLFVTVKLSPGSLSGIQSVTADHSADDAWYTLQGVRVDRPGRGIFIYKAKKVKR